MDKGKSKSGDQKLESLAPQELLEIQKQLDADLQSLRRSFQGMRLAASKFQESKGVINTMKTDVEDKEIMVPLTSSLYIPGKIADKENVIVEVGAGYFIEMSLDRSADYCNRSFGKLF